jgi:hypothetical protein
LLFLPENQLMRDPFAAVIAVAFFGTCAVTIKSIAAIWMKRLDARGQSLSTSAIEDRLERIESAVDVIAVEVERIAESQRFAVRLAVERDSGRGIAPPQAGGGRTITPH